jgi:hypothetical protein
MLADSNKGVTDNTDIPLGVVVGVGVPPLLPLQADNSSPVKTIIEHKNFLI